MLIVILVIVALIEGKQEGLMIFDSVCGFTIFLSVF